MQTEKLLPDLVDIVDPIIGLPYDQYDCWALLRFVFKEGWGIDLDDDPGQAMAHVQEVWFDGDTADPLALLQCWDVVIFRRNGFASGHVGIVMNPMQFLHTRKRTGVCIEVIRRWRRHLLQIARLRQLC